MKSALQACGFQSQLGLYSHTFPHTAKTAQHKLLDTYKHEWSLLNRQLCFYHHMCQVYMDLIIILFVHTKPQYEHFLIYCTALRCGDK